MFPNLMRPFSLARVAMSRYFGHGFVPNHIKFSLVALVIWVLFGQSLTHNQVKHSFAVGICVKPSFGSVEKLLQLSLEIIPPFVDGSAHGFAIIRYPFGLCLGQLVASTTFMFFQC